MVAVAEIIQPELDKAGARELTERIQTSVTAVWELLEEAHERKAYKALGYKSFSAYIDGEFDMSRQQAYRLLNKGATIKTLSQAAGAAAEGITERAARDLAPKLEVVAEEVRQQCEGVADPVERTKIVSEVVRRTREPEVGYAEEADSERWREKVTGDFLSALDLIASLPPPAEVLQGMTEPVPSRQLLECMAWLGGFEAAYTRMGKR